jgi:hypothetical protein
MALSAAPAATPQYQIYDIGVVEVGDDASQGFGVSVPPKKTHVPSNPEKF